MSGTKPKRKASPGSAPVSASEPPLPATYDEEKVKDGWLQVQRQLMSAKHTPAPDVMNLIENLYFEYAKLHHRYAYAKRQEDFFVSHLGSSMAKRLHADFVTSEKQTMTTLAAAKSKVVSSKKPKLKTQASSRLVISIAEDEMFAALDEADRVSKPPSRLSPVGLASVVSSAILKGKASVSRELDEEDFDDYFGDGDAMLLSRAKTELDVYPSAPTFRHPHALKKVTDGAVVKSRMNVLSKLVSAAAETMDIYEDDDFDIDLEDEEKEDLEHLKKSRFCGDCGPPHKCELKQAPALAYDGVGIICSACDEEPEVYHKMPVYFQCQNCQSDLCMTCYAAYDVDARAGD